MTHKLQVVFVVDTLGGGGAQRQAVELAARLREEPGVTARIVTYRAVDARDRDPYRGRLAATGVPVDLVTRHRRLDPRFPRRLGRVLADCDVVHAFMPLPALWTWLALRTLPGRHRPVWIAAERCMPSRATRVDRGIQRFVYRQADAVTANARRALEELASELRLPREKLHYLPNGIDLAEWDRAALQDPPWSLDPGCFHAALIGRLSAQKNQELLLAGLSRLSPEERRDWRVWLVGFGASTDEPDLARRIEERLQRDRLGEIVRIVPPTDRVASLVRRVDLLVLPSRFEGFPNVVLEAQAVGTLVAATPVGDVPSLVADGETGLLFRSEDPEDVARALRAARALPPGERAAITGRARRQVEERYAIGRVASAHLALYRSLLARSPRGIS